MKRFFSLNRKRRKEYKAELVERKVKKVKWGISYSVFDDVELLEASLKSVRQSTDYINVVYQKKSWYGDPANEEMEPELLRLHQLGLIDELFEYQVDETIGAGYNEQRKRNFGLKMARKSGVQYFMTMDGDEFYIHDDIEKAKRIIIERGITHSFCSIATYGLSPIRRSQYPCSTSVQFFSRINKFSRLGKNRRVITRVDPTRRLKDQFLAKYFYISDVEMHHMSLIRKDLWKKYKNSSNATVRSEKFYKDTISTFDDECVNVSDVFKLLPVIEKFKRQ